MHINDLLKIAAERRASDLHIKVGSHPVIRVDGELHPIEGMERVEETATYLERRIARHLPARAPAGHELPAGAVEARDLWTFAHTIDC